MNNSSANLTLGYDKAHRLTSSVTSGAMPGTTISYTYNKNDFRLTMTDAIGTTNYTPDALNRLTTLTSNTGTFTFNYDNLSRRTSMTMGNGITATYTYDDASQLTNLVYKDGAVTITSNQYPVYDNVGNRKQEIDINGTHNYNYDELYRLKTATHPTGNPAESFTYDTVGNRQTSHLSTSYTTDELNRLKEDNSFIYGYDADGNMASKKNKATNETTYFYFDAENKLVQVDKYNASSTLTSTSTYFYDGFGRRVKKSISTSTSASTLYYIYDNEDIRFETDGAGAITAEYTHGHGIDEPLAMKRGGSTYYYHTNGLGSVTALTNSSKTVVQSYVYDSFGQIISQSGSITNPYTFTGRGYDPETGLYYYRVRYYDAKIGKFISEDPIGLAGGDVNLYAMVGNNPVNFVDPLGLWTFDFNAGGHFWFPASAGAAGFNWSSSWKPGGSVEEAEFKGRKSEYTIGSLFDFGVSAGAGGFSKCKDGKETTLGISPFMGKYGGVQINFKNGNFDGITVGLGIGISSPVNFTIPFEDFISGYRRK